MFKKNTTKLNLNNKNKSKTINNIIIMNKNHFFIVTSTLLRVVTGLKKNLFGFLSFFQVFENT